MLYRASALSLTIASLCNRKRASNSQRNKVDNFKKLKAQRPTKGSLGLIGRNHVGYQSNIAYGLQGQADEILVSQETDLKFINALQFRGVRMPTNTNGFDKKMMESQEPRLLCVKLAVTTTVLLAGLTMPARALSNAECTALLKRNDVYTAGRLLEPYRQALVESGRAVFRDGRVGRITVMTGCTSGAFDNIPHAVTTDVPRSKSEND
ncbi:MAG: hypothetical protein AAGC70_09070 [Pseudomonadota bacterium]